MKPTLPLLTGLLPHLLLRPQRLPFPIPVKHSIASFPPRLATLPVAIILALIFLATTCAAQTFPYPTPTNHLRVVTWNLGRSNETFRVIGIHGHYNNPAERNTEGYWLSSYVAHRLAHSNETRRVILLGDFNGAEPAATGSGLVNKETKHFWPGQAPEVSCGNASIQVAMWQLPDRVLLAVFNGDEKAMQDATIELDLDALGLQQKLPWQEFIGVRTLWKANDSAPDVWLDFHSRTLSLKSRAPRTYRLIALRRY